ncbi:MAG: serine/threonine protein kinase, partial [Planctomycetales bacterium]
SGLDNMDLTEYHGRLMKCGLIRLANWDVMVATGGQTTGRSSIDVRVLSDFFIQDKILTAWQHLCLLKGFCDFHVGNYILVRELGRGGMSQVYLAKHIPSSRLVALKVLPPADAVDVTAMEKFFIESQTHQDLLHPKIVRAFEYGVDGKVHFLAMEFIDGLNLEQLVQKQGPLPAKLAAKFIRQAATGLEYAHHKGLVHRDVKPANLLVDSKGVVKLSDLGVVHVAAVPSNSTSDSCTDVLGTLDYLAPEQAAHPEDVDSRADLYSLGCTLYFLLAGHVPFRASLPAQILLMHQMNDPPPLEQERPEIPEPLVHICRKLMAKKPNQRFQSAELLQKALDEWIEDVNNFARTQALTAQGVLDDAEMTDLNSSSVIRAKSSRPFNFTLSWESPFIDFPKLD